MFASRKVSRGEGWIIRHHLSATLLDGRAGNGWARLLRCGRDRSGGGFPNAGYEPPPLCGDCPSTARSRPKERPKYRRPKLTPHQQQEARRRKQSGEPVREIARSYKVHNSTISRL